MNALSAAGGIHSLSDVIIITREIITILIYGSFGNWTPGTGLPMVSS